MKKVAVILSGCGYLDGAEITESISTLIALSEAGVEYQCFAPNTEINVTNHQTTKSENEKRNVLVESARITRGKTLPLSELNSKNFDALTLPGGFGAALTFSSWAKEGSKTTVLPEIEKIIQNFYDDAKPIAAFCIAPTLLAKVLGEKQVTLTIGNDSATASEIEKTGAIHENCKVTDFITDREHRIITSPAYMFDEAKPSDVFKGIQGAIKELVEMA